MASKTVITKRPRALESVENAEPAPVIDIGAGIKRIPIRLVGVEYDVRRPKTQLAMALSQAAQAAGNDPDKLLRVVRDFTSMMFTPEDQQAIETRLSDPDDDLDLIHVMQLARALQEKATSLPPTSSGG